MSLKNYIEYYRRNRRARFTNSIFSRVRGGTMAPVIAVSRGAWDENNIFGRCTFCGGLTRFGICVTCRAAHVCSTCREVVQNDETTLPIPYDEEKDPVTHGFCAKCYKKYYSEMVSSIKEEV